MNVTVAGMTVSLGSSAAPLPDHAEHTWQGPRLPPHHAQSAWRGPQLPMPDAGLDGETTQLAARAQAGDRDAFSALIDLHHRAARRVAAAALGNAADAEEAVQDACLTAWRRIDRLDDPAAFRAWLLRITWRKALDRRRSLRAWLRRLRQDREDEEAIIDSIPSSDVSPDDQLLARERDRVLAQMIRSLPPRLRDPLLLAASGEHRYEDIATMLDVPLGTVKWRIADARRMLREKLARLGFSPW